MKPAPMTDEQIKEWVDDGLFFEQPLIVVKAIIAARDAMWQEMLEAQQQAVRDAIVNGFGVMKDGKGASIWDMYAPKQEQT